MSKVLVAALVVALAAPAARASIPEVSKTPAAGVPHASTRILEARRGRGADDPAGHTRRGRGADDAPNHG